MIYAQITHAAKVKAMTLSSMVLSRDWQEVSVLECILGGLQIEVSVEKEPQRALDRLGKSKFDAVIVDCDLNGSSQFLRELQTSDNGPSPRPLVIMGGPQRTPSLDATGALFAFQKPISVEQAVRTFTAARSMILDGRLRYHRAGLEVPVSIKTKGRKAFEGQLVNLSQGGMSLSTDACHRFPITVAGIIHAAGRPQRIEGSSESSVAGSFRKRGYPFREGCSQAATNSGTLAGATISGELRKALD